MNIKLNHILSSLILAGLLNTCPAGASDPAAADVMEPVPAVAPVPVATDEDKGKEEASAVAPVAPLMSSEDMVKLINIVTLMNDFYKKLEENKKNGVNTPADQVFDAVINAAPDGLSLLDSLVNKINGIIQQQDAAPGSKMKGCQACCASFAKGSSTGIAEVQKLLPIAKKYFDLFYDMQQSGANMSADVVITMLIKNGILNDLNSLLKTTAKYNRNAEAGKVLRAAKMAESAKKEELKQAKAAVRLAAKQGKIVSPTPAAQPAEEKK
jgi:hypothetical protein